MPPWMKITVVLYAVHPPRFGLRHPYSQALITIYKSIVESFFDYASKLWIFPLSMHSEVLHRVRAVPGAEVEDVPSFVIAFAKSLHQEDEDMEDEIDHRMESIPESLTSTLYPFQVESVKFAIKRKGKILLGDEMGLGKTLQALAIACAYREDWPLLVVAPSSLRQNWRNEAVKWVPGLTKENTQGSSDVQRRGRPVRTTVLLV